MSLAVRHRVPLPLPATVPAMLAPPGAAAMHYVSQTESNWCWAACGEMLFSQPGKVAHTQCSIASTQFNLACCPSPHAPSACDQGAWPHLAYPPLGLPTSAVKGPLPIGQLQHEIGAGRPVQVCYQWNNGSQTHVALIVDMHPNGDFEVYDPYSGYGQGPRSYNQILTAYGLGQWIISFTF